MTLSLYRASIPTDVAETPNGGAVDRPRVLMSIPTGFQLRQFVHSGVLRLLAEHDLQVVVVSPNHPGEGFTKDLPAENVEVRRVTVASGRLLQRYWAARQHLFLRGAPTDTLRRKMKELRGNYPAVAVAAQFGGWGLRHFPSLRTQALQWETSFLRQDVTERLFKNERVDLVLLGSPGFMAQDALLLHAAVRHSVPVIAAVLSWDNLSSKGEIHPHPDQLLVWSEHMRSEAMNLQGISPERIVVTGAPLYDVFANAGRFGTRSENLRHLGLDPNKRLIVYGTNHAAHFPDEIEVVRQVAQWVESDAFGEPCQLWIRLHPQAVSGPYKVLSEPYRSLESERVRVEFPPVSNSQLLWDLPVSDIDHLVRLLRDSDLVINMASTLAIDSALLDRPVICVAYDPAGDLPYERSVRRYYDYTHMANVVRAGSAQLATSTEDLHEKAVAYLRQPHRDREGRRRIVAQQFGHVDGCSAQRLVEQATNLILGKTTLQDRRSAELVTSR